MRLLSLLILLLGTVLANGQIAPQASVPDFNKIVAEENLYHKKAIQANPTALAVGTNYDLKYHRLEFTVDPYIRYITGAITSYYTFTAQGSTQIDFELVDELTVDSVKRVNQHLTFGHADDVITINLGGTFATGQLDSLTVYYHGIPGNSGFGSFTTDLQNDTIPIMTTLSEPYGARDWWPCKQTLNDKIDSVDVLVTCANKYDVGSNGLLVAKTINGANTTHHWKHRYPIAAYLIAIAVSDYAIYSDYVYLPTDTIEILNYVYWHNLAAAQAQTLETVKFIKLYDSLFIPYPFAAEKYGHAQWNAGGGMEHQTMSFVGGFGFELNSHELAHQWFGDKLTCGSWAEIWLNEGFATYCTGLCYQFTAPQYWMPWKKITHGFIVEQPGGSVYCDDTSSTNRIFDARLSYRKGSYLLQMLRFRMGDTHFFTAIKNYLTDTTLSFNYTKTERLKYHLEEQSGLDLTEYFNDWYYGQGFPQYTLNWTQFPSSRVAIELSQLPSHPSVDFFEGPLPIRLKNETRDTIIVIQHNYNGQVFDIQPGFPVDSIIIDPEIWVIQQNTVNKIDAGNNDGLIIFPNPVKDVLQVRFDSPLYSAVRYDIYDMAGRLMETKNLKGSSGSFPVDMSGYSKGVYFISVWSDYGNNPNSMKQGLKKKIVKM